jgi:hypothetical protein
MDRDDDPSRYQISLSLGRGIVSSVEVLDHRFHGGRIVSDEIDLPLSGLLIDVRVARPGRKRYREPSNLTFPKRAIASKNLLCEHIIARWTR